MATVKASELYVGQKLTAGDVFYINHNLAHDEYEIEIRVIDNDSGEIEYLPMVVSPDEEFEL
ncbi:hypothetical protein CPT_Muldoon_211 [Serratia phage Muldoon]|uniref:Uncharacterized protein n=1 Tax=Serratia phage Muldoon TaxID=2601678 RepID=A0A5P8PHH4_9CAUD|nr:hypothetical protein HYP94_gp179 [Serratia phage Muldoon]QFR56162.1 hypothetical protein CPT_Muldoon_211 [Serratia phage Muldoon]